MLTVPELKKHVYDINSQFRSGLSTCSCAYGSFQCPVVRTNSSPRSCWDGSGRDNEFPSRKCPNGDIRHAHRLLHRVWEESPDN